MPTERTAPEQRWTMKTAMEQIEACQFECEAGPLTNNAAYQWLAQAARNGPEFWPGQSVWFEVKAEADRELARIWTKVEQIRTKQAAKPTGSALPIAHTAIAAMRPASGELAALREALTPSGDTKAAYMGEFRFPFPVFNEDGEEIVMTPNVPWTTIKEIMAAIRNRAALRQAGEG